MDLAPSNAKPSRIVGRIGGGLDRDAHPRFNEGSVTRLDPVAGDPYRAPR